jgi:CheY-like chemotaxis protein
VFNQVLVKPVRESHLVTCLKGLLSGARPLPVESTPASLPAAKASGLVLVAEDNTVNQKVARLLISKIGYQVEVVSNGREALDALRSREFDLVLMDCQMPEMDGFEATRHIREHFAPERGPVIIALTANAMEGEREKCLAVGMDDYLSKPMKPEQLKEMLSHWMSQAASRRTGRLDNA